jgi:hypothetical protein
LCLQPTYNDKQCRNAKRISSCMRLGLREIWKESFSFYLTYL